MLDVPSLRRDMAATPGQAMEVDKDALDAILREVELGQVARRELKLRDAVASITPGAAE